MQEFLEAEYSDHTRLIIAPSMREGRLIRAMYARQVFSKINYLSVLWPLPSNADYKPLDVMLEILKHCESQICRIAKMIRCEQEPIGFDWLEGLKTESFLNWWLSTEPVPDPDGGEKLLTGLPLILQLLGDKYQAATPPSKDFEPLTGDNDANLLAALCLSFEGTPPIHWDSNYSVVFLDSVLSAANKLRERAEKAAKKEEQKTTEKEIVIAKERINVEPLEPSARFREDVGWLLPALSGLGYQLPVGF